MRTTDGQTQRSYQSLFAILPAILGTTFYSYILPSQKYSYSTPQNSFALTIHQSSYQSAGFSFWITTASSNKKKRKNCKFIMLTLQFPWNLEVRNWRVVHHTKFIQIFMTISYMVKQLKIRDMKTHRQSLMSEAKVIPFWNDRNSKKINLVRSS
jgi:hypothetical protein